MATKKFIRRALALVCSLVFICVLISIIRAVLRTPDEITLGNYDELAVKAMDVAQQGAERFFQLGVLVLGSIWALAIVDKDQRVELSDKPELAMFAMATILFVIELYYLQQYNEIIAHVVWGVHTLSGDQGQKLFPNILGSAYLQYGVVVKCFYSGLFVSACMVFSLCRLRDKRPEGNACLA